MLEQYFEDKKIKCKIEKLENDNFITYIIYLKNVTDLKKFNDTMRKELAYILKQKSLQLIVDDDIKIIIKKDSVVNDDEFLNTLDSFLNVAVGVDTNGCEVFVNMFTNPHWLVSGSTGSGKSVFMNNTICYILNRFYKEIETCFIDLKQVEFSTYSDLSTNMCNVATNYQNAINTLDNLINIMNSRYNKYKRCKCKSIKEYNAKYKNNKDKYIFCFIDELAELIQQNKKEVENRLCRLLQLGRASGIHLIVATQRPSADIVSGLLKNNFTTKIAFKVGNMYDSKTAINQKGAENLKGKGDGLLLKNGEFNLIRFQGHNISENIQNRLLSILRRKTLLENIIDWIL